MILKAVAVALTWWVIDAGIHALVFRDGRFGEELITLQPGGLWTRPVLFLLLVGFGVYAQRVIGKLKEANLERERLRERLEEALTKVLEGFIPICSNCKKIRDDAGRWREIEAYVRDRTEAEFSHDACPECAKKLYPDLVDLSE